MGGRLTSYRSLQVRYTSLEAFNFSIRCGELSYNLGSKAFFLRAELKDLKQILCAVFDLGLNQEPVTKRFQLCCMWGNHQHNLSSRLPGFGCSRTSAWSL